MARAAVVIGHGGIAELWADPNSVHPLAHHVTNVVVYEDAWGAVRVRSKVLGLRNDGSVGSVTYDDVVERRDEGWRMIKRVAVLRRPGTIPAAS
ncbi:aromatic-ring-hydroxylating dioxygenase subunit beta [Mycobacterium sp.]|uniref:aromatic-ring-hydroxylating dioxygenase subunit beta n=1 Tax=Mycobacterium sp. TaxID=1785 RepID=UPI0011F6EAB8|nr:aromatic-ring-hydroxylating dioxygenase subunit beta [Mycobacterium sp.]TAM65170.1 MAG: hypothetical protein EPN51_20330 [Mycobacterium sp.]